MTSSVNPMIGEGSVAKSSRAVPVVSGDAVWSALGTVIDPELGLPITDLGLVYEVEIEDDTVFVEMTTTTPVCPLGSYLTTEVERRIAQLPLVAHVEVVLTQTPLWTIDRISEEARSRLGIR